jgi:hypothetical protein
MSVDPKIIYLEADEEVTSVVDKLRKTEFKEVVLVVPKQAGLLQSVVNLKLIKRQADTLGKAILLVTQDKSGRNLAEKIGIPTSTKVGGKFEIREYDEDLKDNSAQVEDNSSQGPLEETEEVLIKDGEIDEEDEELILKEGEELENSFSKKNIPVEENGEKDKGILPRFPYLKVFAGISVFLLFLLAAGFVYLPRAKATILMNTEKKQVTIDFSGKKDVALDTERAIIPTKIIEAIKESTKTFPATGKRNVGTKATGTILISNMSGKDVNWVSGTRFSPTSNTALVFKAINPVIVRTYDPPITVEVEAAEPGDQYNGFGGQSFTLTGGGLDSKTTIVCVEGITGGTNKEVSYVTEGDLNSAKTSVTNDAFDEATTEFNKQVEDLKVLEDSKKKEEISFSSNPVLNTVATEFSYTVKVSIKAIAFSVNDVSSLVEADVERQLGFAKEVIDSGSDDATVSVVSSDLATGDISATVSSIALVSNRLDQEKIKADITGLGANAAETYLKGFEGVSSVEFNFWPSFIKIFPRMANHIYLTVSTAGGE